MLDANEITDALQKVRYRRLDTLLLLLAVDAETPKTISAITSLGMRSGSTEIARWNISDVLKKSGGLAVRLSEGWCLSSFGRDHIRSLNVLPERKSVKILQHAAQFKMHASKINNADTRSFVEEAIAAYEVGLYRSSIVLSWIGAVSLLYDHMINNGLSEFNAEARKRDPKWVNAKSKDDLARMKESAFLEIICSPPLSVIGKNLKEELKNNCLQLRNACGHPNSFKIGENKASAHLEILILNIYSKFS